MNGRRRASSAGDRPDRVAARARLADKANRTKRFYATAESARVEGRHTVLLDGRAALTPLRRTLWLPTAAAAAAVAQEFRAQTDTFDVSAMPMTRLAHTALDGVVDSVEATREGVLAYAACDLLCYRAEDPQALVERQTSAWDPVLAWARAALGAALRTTSGVTFATQPKAALDALARAIERIESPYALTALHAMTTLAGSALLALAVAHGRLEPDAAWSAACVDEDFQAMAWGVDPEAAERRRREWIDFEAAARLTRLAAAP